MMIHAPVLKTKLGTEYLQHSGVAVVGRPTTSLSNMSGFLSNITDGDDYLRDDHPHPISNQGGFLSKIAGQMCYQSFGTHRTKTHEGQRYIANILTQGHGSVLEHANYTVLLYGISRSCTHELVRHRAGCAFSQTSQRYVDAPRFVERPEFQHDPDAHRLFLDRIDRVTSEYRTLQSYLIKDKPSNKEGRIAANQAARALLPNEVESPIVMTANLRAWRHILNLRGSQYAEPEIRGLAVNIFTVLQNYEPWVFQDMSVENGRIVSHFPKV